MGVDDRQTYGSLSRNPYVMEVSDLLAWLDGAATTFSRSAATSKSGSG